MKVKKLVGLIGLWSMGAIMSMCARQSAATDQILIKEDSAAQKWAGDNRADFRKQGLDVDDSGAGIYPRVPYAERRVGIAYTTWLREDIWTGGGVWTYPRLGKYHSDDREVIRKHAEWLADAGVDFVWVDWSNNLDYTTTPEKVLTDQARPDFAMIERSTLFLFEEYSKMRAEGKKTPNISIFIGNPDPKQVTGVSDGRLTRKADQVYQWFLNNAQHPEYKELVEIYEGKPLLVSYAGTPTPWQTSAPPWNDNRYTVRFMTGYVTEQRNLFNLNTRQSTYNYWSWEERGAQTFSVSAGRPEAMTVVPSWRPQGKEGDSDFLPARGRLGGKTFREQWARARLLGVRFAMVGTWNEYVTGEQYSAEISKDIEPNETWGDTYLLVLKEEIKKFKGVK